MDQHRAAQRQARIAQVCAQVFGRPPLPAVVEPDSLQRPFERGELDYAAERKVGARALGRRGAVTGAQAQDVEQMVGEAQTGELKGQLLGIDGRAQLAIAPLEALALVESQQAVEFRTQAVKA